MIAEFGVRDQLRVANRKKCAGQIQQRLLSGGHRNGSTYRIKPVQNPQGLGRTAHRRQRTKSQFGIMPGERSGGQILKQFVDADFTCARELLDARVLVFRQANGHG